MVFLVEDVFVFFCGGAVFLVLLAIVADVVVEELGELFVVIV